MSEGVVLISERILVGVLSYKKKGYHKNERVRVGWKIFAKEKYWDDEVLVSRT